MSAIGTGSLYHLKSDWPVALHPAVVQCAKDGVETFENSLGKAVRASRAFSSGDLVIRGWGEPSPVRTRHTIQVDVSSHIVPEEPFVWLNHSCQPNCGLLICPENAPWNSTLCVLSIAATKSLWTMQLSNCALTSCQTSANAAAKPAANASQDSKTCPMHCASPMALILHRIL